jgi:hypothetical protein
MSIENCHYRSGDVVAYGRRNMILLEHSGAQCVLCPVISVDEATHRADVEPAWCELISSGLSKLDIKIRAIATICPSKGLRRMGSVSDNLLCRIRSAALREQSVKTCEAVRWSKARHNNGVHHCGARG